MESLVDAELFKIENETVSIKWLDEQYKQRLVEHKRNVKQRKEGGLTLRRAKALRKDKIIKHNKDPYLTTTFIKMIVNKEDNLKYLYAFKEGKIKRGLGIGNELDNWFVHKRGSFTVIVGLDNVGKTFSVMVLLCLSIKHNVKWCIWSGENSSGQLTRDLIQMYAQRKLTNLTKSQIDKYNDKISKWFTFVSNNKNV